MVIGEGFRRLKGDFEDSNIRKKLYSIGKCNSLVFKAIRKKDIKLFLNSDYYKDNKITILVTWGICWFLLVSTGIHCFVHIYDSRFRHYSIESYLKLNENIDTTKNGYISELYKLGSFEGYNYTINNEVGFHSTNVSNNNGIYSSILIITINRDYKNDKDGYNIQRRQIGILLEKDENKNMITFKIPKYNNTSFDTLFGFQQQTVSINKSEYDTVLLGTSSSNESRMYVKAAIVAAYDLGLIDLEKDHFNII